MSAVQDNTPDVLLDQPPDGPPPLWELYHENSKLHPLLEPAAVRDEDPNRCLSHDVGLLAIADAEGAVATGGKRYLTATTQPLPDVVPTALSTPFAEVQAARRSRRDYPPQPAGWESLGAICRLTYGWNPGRPGPDGELPAFRFVPSSGGLFPLEIYLTTPDDDRTALWHYEPGQHLLEKTGSCSSEHLATCFSDFPKLAPAHVVLLTGVPARLTWKYGDRSYRYLLLEAGHAGQNLALAAAALGLPCCPVEGFYDDFVHDLLDIDGSSEIVLYAFFLSGIGNPNGGPQS